jgi:hypothetical protein
MAALEYVDVPGYSALLLRRTFADLSKPGALLDRAHQWLSGTAARWSAQNRQWTFPSGATLSFGYLEKANDHYRYQGSEYQYVGFDELTQFPRHQYTYLFSRLRRLAGVEIPLRVRAGSNPGGLGHQWVFERFIDSPATDDRVFVPATLDDNPHLDRAEYEASLEELDPVERERLRRGNWFVRRDGLVFAELEDCVVAPRELPEGRKVGGIDWGFNNPFAALPAVLDGDDVLWVHSERYKRLTAISEHSKHLARDGTTWWADPAGADQIAELRLANHHVLPCVHLGRDPLMTGIDRVNHRIRTGRLKVFSTLVNLRKLAGSYHYEENKLSERPVDADNHALSALRYLIVGLDRGHAVDYTAPDRTAEREQQATDEQARKSEAWHDVDNDAWWDR